MQTIDRHNFIIFLHIQKTGGITLQRLLRRKLGKSLKTRAVGLINKGTHRFVGQSEAAETEATETIEQQLQQKQLSDRYAIGHFCYGIHQFLPQPFTYMSFLREPVSRIVSLYHYSKANPTAYYHHQAANNSLEVFALETQLMELDNGQTRFLAGDKKDCFINRTPIGTCDEQLLETAKQNIVTHFSFIGITEQFDQSILLMQQLMGWDSSLYLRRNATRSHNRNALSTELKSRIAARNWLDVQLYEYVKAQLNQQLEEQGITDWKVKRFQAENAKFNSRISPFYNTYSQLKTFALRQGSRPS